MPTLVAKSVASWCRSQGVNQHDPDPQIWRAWAIDTLAKHGLSREPGRSLTIADLASDCPEVRRAIQEPALHQQRLFEFLERVAPGSAEWFAVRIELASSAPTAAHAYAFGYNQPPAGEQVATVVGELLKDVAIEWLLPDARLGLKKRSANRKASKHAAEDRTKATAARDARLRAAALKFRREEPSCSNREMARSLATTLRMNAETVRGRLRIMGIK